MTVDDFREWVMAARELGVLAVQTPELSFQLDMTSQPMEQTLPAPKGEDFDMSLCFKCQENPQNGGLIHGLCRACQNERVRTSTRG